MSGTALGLALGLPFRAAGGFNPASLFTGGVQGVWYDPSDSTTIFEDTAGTIPSPTPGAGALSVVGSMLDKRAPSYSVFFDGAGDYLSTPNDTALQLTNSIAFTIECWINPSSIGTARFVFKNYLDSGLFSGYAFGIGCDSSDSQLQFWDGNVWRKFGLLSANVWTHVAITYEGSGTIGRVFVNGTQAGASFTVNSNINATTGTAFVGAQSTTLGFFPGYISNLRIVKGTAVYTANFTPPTAPLSPISGTSLLTCGTSWTGNPAITVVGDTKISQINPFATSPLGNHAISYNTTTARPELSARVNLLTYSEQFDNPAWFRVGGDITSTNTLAPDNTNTADTFTATSGSARHCILNTTAFAIISGAQYVNTMYIKKGNYNFITLIYLGLTTTTAWITVTVDFSGAVPVISKTGAGANATYTTSSVTNAGNGFYRVSVTGSVVSTTACVEVALSSSATPTYGTYGEEVWTAAGGETVIVWGADLRPANIGTSVPAYQRIADQYTYDSSGFPRYLVFNGTASGMYTPANLNLSGTDKATVFAGVRKISDAADGVIAELSNNFNGVIGGFIVNYTATGVKTAAALKGNIGYSSGEFTDSAAPVSEVLSTLMDMGLSTNEISFINKNGVAQTLTRTNNSNNTSNFGTFPLNIGVRSATATPTVFLNGWIYSLIVVGAASTAAQISSTESWINGKEGGVY